MVKSFFFLILTMYTQHHIANGIRDTYRCDFIDTFDPDWVDYEHYESLTRIECGTLCYERRWSCMYWGYNGSCYLLKNSVDKDKCSKEDCSSPGMKIYKVLYLYEINSVSCSFIQNIMCHKYLLFNPSFNM